MTKRMSNKEKQALADSLKKVSTEEKYSKCRHILNITKVMPAAELNNNLIEDIVNNWDDLMNQVNSKFGKTIKKDVVNGITRGAALTMLNDKSILRKKREEVYEAYVKKVIDLLTKERDVENSARESFYEDIRDKPIEEMARVQESTDRSNIVIRKRPLMPKIQQSDGFEHTLDEYLEKDHYAT